MSSDESEPEYIGSSEAAFSVLGDETRLRVLLELADATSAQDSRTGLTFSELRRRVGVEDSGRFNYHLDRLREGFIEKSGDNYVLRSPGYQIVSGMYAGIYGGPVEEQTAESRFDCPECDRSLEITYGDGQLNFGCEEHGVVLGYPVPPGAYSGRSLSALATVTIDKMLSSLYLILRGICPWCWGRVDIEYPVTFPDTPDDSLVHGQITCERCWLEYVFLVRALVGTHPAVLGFYTDHGLDPAESLIGSEAVGYTGELELELNGDGDGTATVTVELDGERLVVELAGGTPLVTDHRRER